MRLSLVVAMAENRVIGRDNKLPWHLPADLRHFKRLTLGKPVLMGRRTWESIGRPLPERTNIVITRTADYMAPGCVVVHSLEAALRAAGHHPEVMVIGGAELYRLALPLADRIYLTLVQGSFEGDTFFPELEESDWNEVAHSDFDADEKNSHAYSFVTLDRVS